MLLLDAIIIYLSAINLSNFIFETIIFPYQASCRGNFEIYYHKLLIL